MGSTLNISPETGSALLEDQSVSDLWVYLLGERSGRDVKIGKSTAPTLRERVRSVNREQTTSENYVLLCGIRASAKDESRLKEHFKPYRRGDKGAKTEYFAPEGPLVEYAHWLRAQWWSVVDDDLSLDDAPAVDPEHWLPNGNGRSLRTPDVDPEMLVQQWQILEGPLAGTAWDWMPDPRPSIQDYYTPPEIVQAAREAMGGIDLDAASHWLANRTLRIPDYFTIGRSAFENDWHGRVWLNPPYGNNKPWFDRIVEFTDGGDVEQLCMLSPVWAFNTSIAAEVIERVSAMVLLSPTPTFWGNADGKTGTNQPHCVVYIGERVTEFLRAFSAFGIPFSLVTAGELQKAS